MLKKYLDEKKFSYTEKVADTDESIARELYEVSHQLAVPYTIIEKDDGTKSEILGYDVQKVNAALGIA